MTNERLVKHETNEDFIKLLQSTLKNKLDSLETIKEEENRVTETVEVTDSDCYVFLVKEKRKADATCSVFCKLIRSDWYWGSLRRSEAEALVLKHPGTFIIRDCCHTDNILCITFVVDPNPKLMSFSLDPDSVYNKPGEICHVTIKLYKETFSFDRKEYVPVEDLGEHCARVGRDYNIFNARPLFRDAFRRALMKKKICNWH